jgi:predicted flap endonuclease-1-like 5' DNA nuclease
MGYVFNEIFWWVLAALVIGFFLGWLFWKCRVWLSGADTGGRNAAELAALAESKEAEIASLRSELDGRAATVSELTGKLQLAESNGLELRTRIDELEARASLVPGLESEVAGLAAMRSRMNDLESDNAQIPGLTARIHELEAVSSELAVIKSRVADLAEQSDRVPALQARIAELEAENADAQALRARVLELEDAAVTTASVAAIPAALTALGSDDLAFESDMGNGDGSGHPQTLLDLAPAAITDDGTTTDQPEAELDLTAAAAVLGKRIRKDDLTAVEGIGPKISDIIRADGVTTWRSLSLTSPGHIKELLDAAGPRFQMHDPGTWPTQAGLLADGRWEDFVALTAELDGGVRRTGDRSSGFM